MKRLKKMIIYFYFDCHPRGLKNKQNGNDHEYR